jgi:hypothetical protein
MKKNIALTIALVVSLFCVGCDDNSPNAVLPQLMHNDVIYYFDSNGQIDIEITPTRDAPKITSTISSTETPSENGQANFEGSDFCGEGSIYITYGDGLLVFWNERWVYFVPFELLTP